VAVFFVVVFFVVFFFSEMIRASNKSKKRYGVGRAPVGTQYTRKAPPSQYMVRSPNVKMYVQRTPGGNIVSDNHYFDSELSATTADSSTANWSASVLNPNTTALDCLFAPVIGDDIANRSGRKVFLKKIRIFGQMAVAAQSAQTAQDTPTIVRVVVVEDQQTNATAMTGGLVLAQGSNTLAIHMGMSTTNFGRFRILKDKTYVLQAADYSGLSGAFVAAGVSRTFKFSIKVNKWINFNGTNGGTVADIVDNSYHFMAHTQGTNGASISYKVRGTFSP